MKIKAIILTLLLGLNLIASEILTPQEAVDKFYEYNQINEVPADPNYDYMIDTTIKPSFKCSNKFEKYSLEDFICNSNFNAFKDNYFASLYNTIIKQNQNLKSKALKLVRERIKETKKECMIFDKETYGCSFDGKCSDATARTIGCISSFYRQYSSKLALMLYNNDKELFKKIFGDDYEKFKEAFEDTLTLDKEFKTNEEYRKSVKWFKNKYKAYEFKHIYAYLYTVNIIYILSIQYNLIDSTGKFK